MADDKRNIEIKFNTNAEETKGKVDKLNKSVEDTAKVTNDATKSTDKLTESVTSNGGAMAILDSITGGYATRVKDAMEASNLFKKSTDGMTISQRAYTAVVGTSTGALKTFRIALAATGIGAIVVLLGLLIANWDKLTGALTRAEKAQKAVNDAMAQGTSNAKAESAELLRLVAIARDETASKEARLAAIKAINEVSPEYLGNITLDTINTEQATVAINNYVIALGKKMQAQAIEKAIQKTYDDELEFRTKQASDYLKWYDYILNGWYDIDEAARNRQEEDVKDTLSQRRALENQLQELLEKNPELIYDANKKSNSNILKDTQSTNKKIVESEEEKYKRIMQLQKDRLDLLREIRDLEIEMIDNPSDKAIAERDKKLDKLYSDWENRVNSLNNLIADDELFDKSLAIIDGYYENLISNINKDYDELSGNVENIATLFDNIDNNLFTDSLGGFLSYYQVVSQILDAYNSINDAETKARVSEIYNIPKLEENLQRYQELFTKNREFLENETLNPANNPEDGWVLTSLFGKGGTQEALSKMERFYEDQRMFLDLQELAANRASETELERTEIKQFYANRRTEIDREEYENNKKLNDLRLKQQLTALDSYSSALDATSQLMGEHTAGHKTLAIASATIDTYTSAVASYKGMVEAIPGPVGIAAGVAAAAASVAMGLNNVKQILSVKVPGGSGSGSGGGSNSFNQPNVDFVSSSENQIATTVGDRMQSNNEPIKAYVVSSEVSSQQALDRRRVESNSL